jgi:glycosyltransferase involved in cell wall biosynthesis
MSVTHLTVSVVIPTYNRAHVLERAIQSALRQTYQHFEVIVVDDGSTDNTAEVVNSICDERVKYVRHQVNKGTPSAARNTGIRVASGELIGFLDSDDEWLPEKLQKQVERFCSTCSNVGVIYGGYAVVDDNTESIIGEVHPKKRGYIHKEVLKLSIPATPLIHLVKKECFEKVGFFDEELRFAEDFDMWVRIAQYYEFDFVDEIVAKYHVSQHQITQDRLRTLAGFLKFMAKHQDALLRYPDALGQQLKYVGQCYLMQHEYASARRYFVKAVRANPRGLYLYFHLLAAYFIPCLYGALLLDTHKVLLINKYRAIHRRLFRTR